MRERPYILLLAALLAVLALAVAAEAQTPPPASGDWSISDETTYSDAAIDIDGDIVVYAGGHLTLTNVDLTMTTYGFASIDVRAGGNLTMRGGTVQYTGLYPPRVLLSGLSSLDGVDIYGTYGVQVYDWGCSITNCTFRNNLWSISATPGNNMPATWPLVISNNTIQRASQGGIGISIGALPSENPLVEVIGNTILDGGSQGGIGIDTVAGTSSARLIVEDNKVSTVDMEGIYLDLESDHTYVRFNRNEVDDTGTDGIRFIFRGKTVDLAGGLSDLVSVNSVQACLRMVSMGDPVNDVVLSNLTLRDGALTALSLTSIKNVTLVDSVIDNPSAVDFTLTHATLEVYRTVHDQGDASVYYADSKVTSWRSIELVCQWQNGVPITGSRVDLIVGLRELVATGVTDGTGHWARQTTWDWFKTLSELEVRLKLEAVLVGPGWNLSGPFPIDFDRDVDDLMTFYDNVTPSLHVSTPAAGHVQNVTELLVTGSCSDVHSGVGLVQVSLDPDPDWDVKSWTDASGTDDWQVALTDVPEGVHDLYVRVFDVANVPDGRSNNTTVAGITVDITPPQVTVAFPPQGAPFLTNLPEVNVTGTVSEEVVLLFVDGGITPVEDLAFSRVVNLTTGENVIGLEATDVAGNRGTASVTVVLDTTPPVITITSPAPGTLLNSTWVHVTGSVDTQVLGDLVRINGALVPLTDGEFEYGLQAPWDGAFDINITTTDLTGNEGTASTHVLVDTVPPTVQVISPDSGHITNQVTLRVVGATEAGATVTVSGLPADVVGVDFSIDIELVEGTNTLRVVARDAAGNTNSTGVTVVLDTVPPELEVSGAVDGTISTYNSTYLMRGTTEPGATLRFSSGGMDFDGVVHPDGSWNQDFLLEGELTSVMVTVTDPAGNSDWTEVTVELLERPGSEPAPVVSDPVVVTVVATSTVLIVGAALVSIEFTKYSLILLLMPLYARLKRQEVLDNKTRLAIHGLVVENPGMHYNEIIREFGLTNGVAAYHLDVLEREGFVRSVRDGTLRRFFSTSTKVPTGFKMTPDQMRERIIELVEGHPGINQKAIVDELGIGRTLVGYHLKTLKDEGYLKASRQGRFTVYTRTKKRWHRNA